MNPHATKARKHAYTLHVTRESHLIGPANLPAEKLVVAAVLAYLIVNAATDPHLLLTKRGNYTENQVKV